MKIYIVLALFAVQALPAHAVILSVNGNWALTTTSSETTVAISEVAMVGPRSESSIRTGEGVFQFDLSSYSTSQIVGARLSIYGGTNFSRILHNNVDLFGLPNFVSPPNASSSRFSTTPSAANLLQAGAISSGVSYTEQWFSLEGSAILSFLLSERSQSSVVAFRLSPSIQSTMSAGSGSFYFYNDVFNPNFPILEELSPKLTLDVVPEPTVTPLFLVALIGVAIMKARESLRRMAARRT